MNTIEDLRAHLFATLEGLRDKDKPMDIDRAKAVADVAQTLINSAKVEVEHLKIVGGTGTGFIGDGTAASPGTGGQLPQGITGIRQHRLR
jgi:hypothetical protein